MYEPNENETYSYSNAIKSNVAELYNGNGSYLEDAEMLATIFRDVDKLLEELESAKNVWKR